MEKVWYAKKVYNRNQIILQKLASVENLNLKLTPLFWQKLSEYEICPKMLNRLHICWISFEVSIRTNKNTDEIWLCQECICGYYNAWKYRTLTPNF